MDLVLYIPLATTFVAAAFSAVVLRRYLLRQAPHLLWWGVGLILFGAGTALEGATTLLGWQEWLFRSWYVAGALLGGAPLAQGTVYLHFPRRFANTSAVVLIGVVAVAAVLVMLSPVDADRASEHRLSGQVLGWTWVRAFSPFVNTYAFVFLVGGAVASARQYRRQAAGHNAFMGNTLIAVGAVLPGIGGTFTRFGHVEVLYVTEFAGICLIWAGYGLSLRGREAMSPTAVSPRKEHARSARPA
jgi:hypothetical protein